MRTVGEINDDWIARLSVPGSDPPMCSICRFKIETYVGADHSGCLEAVRIARLSPLPDNSHYAGLGMQPWGYIIANELNFFEGNVVKYVTRWKHKNGLDDLRKARVYIDELIRQEEAK